MSGQSMRECLQETVDRLRWHVGDAAFWPAVDADYLTAPMSGGTVSYLVGYLLGAADALDVTVRTVLDEYGVDTPTEE